MSRFSWIMSGVLGGFSAGATLSFLGTHRSGDSAGATDASDQLSHEKPELATREGGQRRPVPAGSAPRESLIDGFETANPYQSAIEASRKIVLQAKEVFGSPGLTIAVNVDGCPVWAEGFGFADVENGVPCTPNTVMRIASISKSLTVTALARLWQEGKLDLDLPVQHYVPKFPPKQFEGEPVEITTKMLVSHLSGIRHWKGGEEKEPSSPNGIEPEFYMNKYFKTVEDALSIFQDDDLIHRPGTTYLYSSPAWTLISAVMEKAAGVSYREIMMDLFCQLGLRNTSFDENNSITFNRSRYYVRNKNGKLTNSPCVDNSCKWAGGGLQSTVNDLVKFGDAMLYCYQNGASGYLEKNTIDALWTISPNTIKPQKGLHWISGYGMGWAVTPALKKHGGVEPQSFSVNHTGGAVGASSILFIAPSCTQEDAMPSGVTVAIIVNMQQVGLTRTAQRVAETFRTVQKGVLHNNP